jgi:hypothetical protein
MDAISSIFGWKFSSIRVTVAILLVGLNISFHTRGMIFGRLDFEACAVVNLPTDSVWRYFLA